MTVFELTRALIDIDSVTPNEERVGDYLYDYLSELAARTGGTTEKLPVAPHRNNILARWGDPLVVTLSTHIDTVPPFFPSREDDEFIWGRGACDTKGIIASMIHAIEGLLQEGVRGFGILLVVGEERNSLGALTAAKDPRGSRYLINGEPTENKLILGSKGALRFEIIAKGKAAHSAYPELGDSAILKLLKALARIRKIPMPVDEILGPSSLNIGTIQGGRAPNVIPDEAMAELFFRLVDSGDSLRAATQAAVADIDGVEAKEVLAIPAVHLASVQGFETGVVSYTTDIPAFDGAWGRPLLFGPGTIHVAHTADEHISKKEMLEAIEVYKSLIKRLLAP